MRSSATWMVALLAGACDGATERSCVAECGALCASAAAELVAAAGPPAQRPLVYLSTYESLHLAEARSQLVGGILPVGDRSLAMCAGAGPCFPAPGLEREEVLPPGTYSLSLRGLVPLRGTWTAEASAMCGERELMAPVQVDLTPYRAGSFLLDPLATFTIPPDALGMCVVDLWIRPIPLRPLPTIRFTVSRSGG